MPSTSPALNVTHGQFDAVLFDLDGVVTQTAKVHAAAWKRLFDDYLEERAKRGAEAQRPFDADADYNEYVDGKPRYEGVKSFLESRGMALPYGSPDDPEDAETVCGLGNRKNRLFNVQLDRHGVDRYPEAIALIRLLRRRGFRTAVVSSSKNCQAVLKTAGIEDLFDARVDGVVSSELNLKGKPDPDIFVEAARRLGAKPERSMVLEDAVSGVQAGRGGNFGAVIGVDRVHHAEALKKAGADVVVSSLEEIAVEGETPMEEQSIEALPSALSSLEEIRKELRDKRPFVALDYDGTLTPIVERPELAVLSDEMRAAVSALADRCTVAVISGRDLQDVRNLVGLENLFYAGSHGFDIAGPAGKKVESQQGDAFLPTLDEAERELESRLEPIEGSQIERKKYSIAVHFRRVAPDRAADVEAAVDDVLKQHDRLRKGLGKKVFELQPKLEWHKGKALRWLMEVLELNGSDVLAFYIGDDVTDEDAFRELRNDGCGILVLDAESGGNSDRSAARYTLNGCPETRAFLEQLTETLRKER